VHVIRIAELKQNIAYRWPHVNVLMGIEVVDNKACRVDRFELGAKLSPEIIEIDAARCCTRKERFPIRPEVAVLVDQRWNLTG
jgi:hypothetical protein